MHELHQPRRYYNKCHIFETLLCPPASGLLIAPSGKNNACPKHCLPSFPTSPPAVRSQQAQFSLHHYPDPLHPLHPRAAFKEQCWALGSHTAVANLGAGVGSDIMVTGSVPTPNQAPTLTRCITSPVKILSYSQVCNISCPKSPTQQIRFSVKFLLSELQQKRESPANKKCLCNCTSPHFCANSICKHLSFLCCLSPPFLTAIKEKSRQKGNCWEFLLLYAHKTPI